MFTDSKTVYCYASRGYCAEYLLNHINRVLSDFSVLLNKLEPFFSHLLSSKLMVLARFRENCLFPFSLLDFICCLFSWCGTLPRSLLLSPLLFHCSRLTAREKQQSSVMWERWRQREWEAEMEAEGMREGGEEKREREGETGENHFSIFTSQFYISLSWEVKAEVVSPRLPLAWLSRLYGFIK